MKKLSSWRTKVILGLTLMLALMISAGLWCIPKINVDASVETSIFSFVPTNDSECTVRLSDKTVTRAIIPKTAEINGQIYTVTSIAANGFASAINLEKVRLPDSVKTIEQAAFLNCKALRSITMPKVVSIGRNAFGMTKLDYLILPKTVTTVGSTILRGTSTKVYVRAALADNSATPAGSWSSDWNANNGNQNVEYNSEYIPEIKYIHVSETSVAMTEVMPYVSTPVGYVVDEYQEFCEEDEYGNRYVYIPAVYNGEPVIGIKEFAFTDNTIDIIIGYSDRPITISSWAFYAAQVNSIIINRDINQNYIDYSTNEITEEESSGVFSSSTVSSIALPNTITILSDSMFEECTNLKNLIFIEPQDYDGDESSIITISDEPQSVNLPKISTFTTIGNAVFRNTNGIKELNIPNNVVNVGSAVFEGWRITNNQKINIDYESENDLPSGWQQSWNSNCDVEVIEFNSNISYQITYHVHDGSLHDNPLLYTRKDQIELKDAILAGYIFEGWFDNPEYSGNRIQFINKGTYGNLEFYAKQVAIEYTISYEENKPEKASGLVRGNTSNSYHRFDESAMLTTNGYTLDGWKFVGWKNDKGENFLNGQEVLNLTCENNETIKLYAQWEPIQYIIKFSENKPKLASQPMLGDMSTEEQLCSYDNEYILIENQYHIEGWHFVGWNISPYGTGRSFVDNATFDNITTNDEEVVYLYAQWEANDYTIKYEPNKPATATHEVEGPEMGTSQHEYDMESTITKNTYTLVGWHFVGWNTAEDGTDVTYLDQATVKTLNPNDGGQTELYAQWKENKYTIKYEPNKPATATHEVEGPEMGISQHEYDVESTLTKNTYTLVGWHFVGWNAEKDGTGEWYSDQATVKTLNPNDGGQTELHAQWKENKYTIKYEGNRPVTATHEVSGNMDASQHEYDVESTITKNTYTLVGWHFVGWNTAEDGTGEWHPDQATVKTGNSNNGGETKLFAQWEANIYKVEYYPNAPKIGSGATGNVSYTTHTYDTPGNLAYNGFYMVSWAFEKWSIYEQGGKSYSQGASVMNLTDKDKDTVKLYAQWTPKPLSQCGNSTAGYEIVVLSQLEELRNFSAPGVSVYVLDDFLLENWRPIPVLDVYLYFNNHEIKIVNHSISYEEEYGFVLDNQGRISDGVFYADMIVSRGKSAGLNRYGVICAINSGFIINCKVRTTKNSHNFTRNVQNVDLLVKNSSSFVGAIAGHNTGTIDNCESSASIGTYGLNAGGLAGVSYGTIRLCNHKGALYAGLTDFELVRLGGIVGIAQEGCSLESCSNDGPVCVAFCDFVNADAYMGQIAGTMCKTATMSNCSYRFASDVYISPDVLQEGKYVSQYKASEEVGQYFDGSSSGGGCVATGTLITLADGRQVPVETLCGNELLLVWNMNTGSFDYAPIIFVDSESMALYDVINLYFSDGTTVKVISEHGFWDYDLNKYVYLDENASQYIGHWFNKQSFDDNGNMISKRVQLTGVEIKAETTVAYSPVTYGHLCYYVNGMLSMPGGIDGLFNIFEVNPQTMRYDEALMATDIERYGLYTYEEFSERFTVPEAVFEAFGGQYLKISIGKGLINEATIEYLIERYSEFFVG